MRGTHIRNSIPVFNIKICRRRRIFNFAATTIGFVYKSACALIALAALYVIFVQRTWMWYKEHSVRTAKSRKELTNVEKEHRQTFDECFSRNKWSLDKDMESKGRFVYTRTLEVPCTHTHFARIYSFEKVCGAHGNIITVWIFSLNLTKNPIWMCVVAKGARSRERKEKKGKWRSNIKA